MLPVGSAVVPVTVGPAVSPVEATGPGVDAPLDMVDGDVAFPVSEPVVGATGVGATPVEGTLDEGPTTLVEPAPGDVSMGPAGPVLFV